MSLITLSQIASVNAKEHTRIAIAVDPEGQTCVLGGGVNGAPLEADLISKIIKPRQNFRLYSLLGAQRKTLWPVGKPDKIDDDERCNPYIRQELSLAPYDLGKPQVAIFDDSGNKRIAVLPKKIQVMSTDDEKYTKILADFLASTKVENTTPKIRQLIRTDLDGDGKDEVIINAVDATRQNERKGEYSIVLVEREKNGARVVETVQKEITPEDSDQASTLWENTIAAVADLDADGVMEIIMYGQFFHGYGWDVVRLDNLTAERPILCGCGG